jgi:hypothetical protein
MDVFWETDLFQCLVNDIGVLEMVIREEIELVQKVADIDATQRIHLREWQHTGET